MTNFTTRVELHNAGSSDYTKLHSEMMKNGFETIIVDTDGKKWHLPTAEYNYSSATADKSDVLSKAKDAASAVVKSFEILVTQSGGRTWHNLTKA